ncbi:MAG: sugar phosphate isomerase/epimerase family protein [Dermatophilaceae bacterium]
MRRGKHPPQSLWAPAGGGRAADGGDRVDSAATRPVTAYLQEVLMAPNPPPVGVAHLTLLRLSPPELVVTAAQAGFDFVGVRVKAATSGEHEYPMAPGSAMSKETLLRLEDTGLFVLDAEFVTLGPETGPDEWLAALEAAAALDARTISVVSNDADRGRFTDTLGRLAADAQPFGVLPTLEPISYNAVSRVEDAAALAEAVGCAVLLDALHIQRGGSSLDAVRALDPALIPVVQLCDGPLELPDSLDVPDELPLGMTTDGSARQGEARALRQVPGEGEFPLLGLLAAIPPETPLSVEVPSARLQAKLSPLEYAVRNHDAARRLVEASRSTRHPGGA